MLILLVQRVCSRECAQGVDGWKVDGTDPFLLLAVTPVSKEGLISLEQYQDWTYGHFYNHTRDYRGPDTIIWSRPVDGTRSTHERTRQQI